MEIRNFINENKTIFFIITALVIGLTIVLTFLSFQYSPKVVKPDQATINAAMERISSTNQQVGAGGELNLAPTQISSTQNAGLSSVSLVNTPATAESKASPFLLIIIIFPLIILIGLAIFFLMRTESKNQNSVTAERQAGPGQNTNDQKRKADLERLQKIIEGFYKIQKRYPDETEFKNLYIHMDSPPKDPLEGETVPGNGTPPFYQFGYYYQQRQEGSKTNNPQHYRLWGFLENGQLYRLTSEDKTPPTVEPVIAAAPSAPPATPAPSIPIASATPSQIPLVTANSALPQIYFSPTINTYQPPQPNSSTSFLMILMTVINAAILIVNLYFVFLRR